MDKASIALDSDTSQASVSGVGVDEFTAIVERGAASVSAVRCLVAFETDGTSRVIRAREAGSRWDSAMEAALAALEKKLGADGRSRERARADSLASKRRVVLRPRELDGTADAAAHDGRGAHLAAAAFVEGDSAVRIALATPENRAGAEIEASLELIAAAIFAEINLNAARASLEFWRKQGAEAGRLAANATRQLADERRTAGELDAAAAAAPAFPAVERFARFGELVSSAAGFEQWIVAIEEDGAIKIAADSFGLKHFDLKADESALVQCIRSCTPVLRPADGDGIARGLREDKLFGASYVCIPFESGAIALASRNAAASAAMLKQAHAMLERLDPIVRLWRMEAQAARRDALVKQLALRMFAAIDEERSRIARDLHDDQAQLIAAAQIALQGGREEAGVIFRQVGSELRRKTRELRPASLGKATLTEAVEREFERLQAAGVTAKLVSRDRIAVARISRPLQQLCFQVAREAISNVIRHAHAKSVEVAIELADGVVRVSLTDDGRGMRTNGRVDGIGLAGVRERLELMGGRLTLESKLGRTMLVAEIPERA
ncbi:MAG TPA: ATP-binding protein [Candidatus Acidoferrales bacterium]|nr:ATP-binding protein [Candidatus Acidoferrales bacterium]